MLEPVFPDSKSFNCQDLYLLTVGTEAGKEILETCHEIAHMLVKKYVQAISGELKQKSVTFDAYSPFQKITLDDTNVVDIYDVRDGNGNKWYEVPYLANPS